MTCCAACISSCIGCFAVVAFGGFCAVIGTGGVVVGNIGCKCVAFRCIGFVAAVTVADMPVTVFVIGVKVTAEIVTEGIDVCVTADITGCRFCTGGSSPGAICFVQMCAAAVLADMIVFSVFLRPFVCRIVVCFVIVSVEGSASFALRKLGTRSSAAGVMTGVSAYGACPVFPCVFGRPLDNSLAAAPHFGMACFCCCPRFGTGVVGGIN